jgi:uncharacterized protein DUF2510
MMHVAVAGDDGEAVAVMDPAPIPSEHLCALGLQMAARLDHYEQAGGTSHLEDVMADTAFAHVFDQADSVIGKRRPRWRWEIRLRHGRDVETVIGHANGRWSVEGVDRLRAVAPDGNGTLLIEPEGADIGFKPPPADAGASAEVVATPVVDGLVKSFLSFATRRAVANRPPRWHPDPAGRFRFRYWNGARWTRFVLDGESDAPPWDERLDWGKRHRLPGM